MQKIFFVLSILLFSSMGWGHARLTNPTPRNNGDNNKSTSLPCGAGARGTPHVYMPGQTITVDWEETINHTGYFEFFFSEANDQNFVSLKQVTDNQGALVGGVSNKFSTTITFPNVLCNACTLRMIQYMSDNPVFPYQSCIDIALTADGNPPVNPPGGPIGGLNGSTPQPTGEKPGFGCGAEANVKSSSFSSHWTGFIFILLPFLLAAFLRKNRF